MLDGIVTDLVGWGILATGHIAHEAADLIFHTLVGLEATGVPLDAVFGELRRRFGVSGIDEKASRKK